MSDAINNEAVLDVAEKALDSIEEGLDVIEDVTVKTVEVVRNNPVLIAGAAVGGLGVGFAVGYFLLKAQVKTQADAEVSAAIAEARDEFARREKVDDVNGGTLTPRQVLERTHGAEAAAEALASYEEGPKGNNPEDLDSVDKAVLQAAIDRVRAEGVGSAAPESVNPVTKGLFDGVEPVEEDEFDLVLEISQRDTTRPYLISHDEFFENDKDHDNISLSYYDDDVLADDAGNVVHDADIIVNEANLVRFGHGSKDRNIVYVRNEKVGVDYEIVRSKNTYTKDVLGLDEPDQDERTRRASRRAAADDG